MYGSPAGFGQLPIKMQPQTMSPPGFRLGQPTYNAQPFMGRVGQMQPLPIRQQIAQQMTPPMQPPITSGFQGNTGLPVSRGPRRGISPVGGGIY